MVAPLTSLTSTFQWSGEAEAAFCWLKSLFTTAPILHHPDPSHQFVVEVNASNLGVGAVFSQRDPAGQKLHPCVFFIWRPSPAEVNYNIENKDLFAVVLVLQEWRHWLEGSTQPFLTWTDHKNLSYLRNAKGLNS